MRGFTVTEARARQQDNDDGRQYAHHLSTKANFRLAARKPLSKYDSLCALLDYEPRT